MGVRKFLGVWFIVHKTWKRKNLAFEMEAYEGFRFGYFGVTSRWGEKEQ